MAKDPAMLWYWSDWHSGTSLLSRFLKGCYIDLLHAQFNHGHLSLEEIKTCLGSDFGTSWPALQKKFKQDEVGLFFNERLEQEKAKRQAFSESRRNNRTSKSPEKPSCDVSYDEHMIPHMENVNRNSFTTDKRKEDFLKNQLWKEQFAMANRLSIVQVEELQRRFLSDCDLRCEFVDNYQRYFINSWNKKMITAKDLKIEPIRQIHV